MRISEQLIGVIAEEISNEYSGNNEYFTRFTPEVITKILNRHLRVDGYPERIAAAIMAALAELTWDDIIPPAVKAKKVIINIIAQNPCDRCMDKDGVILNWMQTCGQQTDEIAKLKERLLSLSEDKKGNSPIWDERNSEEPK